MENRRHFLRRLACLCIAMATLGCGWAQSKRDTVRVTSSSPLDAAAIVFVANGAGDSRALSESLSRVVAQSKAPLQIETVAWSRGRARILADQLDYDNHVFNGRQLAALVAAQRRDCPGRRICLIGHSAGCAVVLAAAEQLPPDSIDRIVLLAASVCANYDLRPALRASKGIDAYHSEQDRWVLGFGVRVFGTTEPGCKVAAGKSGFTPVISTPADAALYGRLRQHPWNETVQWSGHDGSHSGQHEADFLKAYVLPILLSAD